MRSGGEPPRGTLAHVPHRWRPPSSIRRTPEEVPGLPSIERDRVAAAAHLVRYGDDARVSASYRGVAEIRWLVFLPGDEAAADAVVARGLVEMDVWGATRTYADGALPAPAVWPHVASALDRAGFAPGERIEVVLAADVADLPRGGPAPVDGLTVRRALGGHAADRGVRAGRASRGLRDRRRGDAHLAFLGALGWRELTRTPRGWERRQPRRLRAARAATRTGS